MLGWRFTLFVMMLLNFFIIVDNYNQCGLNIAI